MNGRGESYGAFSILNAALCGIGGSAGVTLTTIAEFSTEIGGNVIETDVDGSLPRICVERALRHMGEEINGWRLNVISEIPPSVGMKSSSSVCNAIISSVFDAYSFECDGMDLVRLGIDCARSAGVTVTGAFDDASACHFGGIHITDNSNDETIDVHDVPEYDVLFHIPNVPRKDILISDIVRNRATDNALLAREDVFAAMTENGRIMASLTGSDNSIAESAIEHGALGAGMTGFGPAVAMVFDKNDTSEFIDHSDIELIGTRTRSLR